MSEYQYYEFLAIDRPLTAREMAELRALSTRAHITPTSFTNEYEWGDFKGDPAKLMRRYFDAHVYLANWANCCFSLRLPREVFEPKTISAFQADHSLFFQDAGEHWVIDWVLNESENYDRSGEDDGRGWMARLAPLREELLRGDLRALYIGWLAAVTSGEIGDSELEPPLPAGLGRMTPAQLALSEFLEVDPDLLAGVSAGSPDDFAQANSTQAADAWIATLSQEDMREALRFMLTGQAGKVERSLKNRFAAWQRDRHSGAATPSPRREVAEIRGLADGARAVRLKRESKARARAEKRRREQREAYLAALAKDVELAWTTAHRRAERGTAAAYDDVTRAIADLAEACALHATRSQFEQALRRFMTQHVRRALWCGGWLTPACGTRSKPRPHRCLPDSLGKQSGQIGILPGLRQRVACRGLREAAHQVLRLRQSPANAPRCERTEYGLYLVSNSRSGATHEILDTDQAHQLSQGQCSRDRSVAYRTA